MIDRRVRLNACVDAKEKHWHCTR